MELLGNLLENAFKWAKHRVLVSAQELKIANARRPGLEIMVEDDGPGVAEEELSHLGQRFWRSLESGQNAAVAGGSGLGLSIVGRIAELHGGQVAYAANKTSATGSGMRIQVRLPKDGAA